MNGKVIKKRINVELSKCDNPKRLTRNRKGLNEFCINIACKIYFRFLIHLEVTRTR